MIAALPILAGITLGAQRLLPVLQQIYSSWTYIRGSKDSIDGAINLLSQPENFNKDMFSMEEPIKFKNRIELKNISFRYQKKGKKLFNMMLLFCANPTGN